LARPDALGAPRAAGLRAAVRGAASNRSGCFDGFFLVADLAMEALLFARDLVRKPVPIPDLVEDMLFGSTRVHRVAANRLPALCHDDAGTV